MSEKFLVIVNKDLEDEEIYYCGDIELLAFKKYKELPHRYKQILKANVEMVELSGVEFINKYEVIIRLA